MATVTIVDRLTSASPRASQYGINVLHNSYVEDAFITVKLKRHVR